jgi:hypothetical protein
MVNNFSAIDALPSEEMFLRTIELLLDHIASAAITLHRKLLCFLNSPSPTLSLNKGRGEGFEISIMIMMISKLYTEVNDREIVFTKFL